MDLEKELRATDSGPAMAWAKRRKETHQLQHGVAHARRRSLSTSVWSMIVDAHPVRPIGEQLRDADSQGPREPADVQQRGIPLASLDASDVGPVQARPLGELLLREARTLAELAYTTAEGNADIVRHAVK